MKKILGFVLFQLALLIMFVGVFVLESPIFLLVATVILYASVLQLTEVEK